MLLICGLLDKPMRRSFRSAMTLLPFALGAGLYILKMRFEIETPEAHSYI